MEQPAQVMQGTKKMEFQKFIKVYNSLNEHHRKIAFQILYLMDRKCKHPSQNETVKKTVYDKIKEKQKELNIGYAELNRKVAEQEEAKEKDEVFNANQGLNKRAARAAAIRPKT